MFCLRPRWSETETGGQIEIQHILEASKAHRATTDTTDDCKSSVFELFSDKRVRYAVVSDDPL